MIEQLRTLIRRDIRGSVAVEVALIAPVIITMVLATLQIGLAMYNYNSLRSVANDIARYAVVQTQSGNYLSDTALTNKAESIAVAIPYGLATSRLTISVSEPGTQRVAGATEKTVSVAYNVPSVLGIIGLKDVHISYSRPVFLTQ